MFYRWINRWLFLLYPPPPESETPETPQSLFEGLLPSSPDEQVFPSAVRSVLGEAASEAGPP